MTQLHLHTRYSILDGLGSAKEYAEKATKYGHKAIGITDHGRMGGILEFQNELQAKGLKPLLGVEQYVTDMLIEMDEKNKRKRTKNSHVILYAANEIGYKNLLNLNWLSVQDDHFYYSPRLLKEELFKYSEGVVVGSACMGSKIGRLVLDDKPEEAEQIFLEYREVFKDNYYLEIQMNEIDKQKPYNDFIIYLANKYSTPLCLTGDVHYVNPGDDEIQTLSIMISKKQTIDDMQEEDFWDIEAKSLYYHNDEDYHKFNKQWNYGYTEDFIKSCLSNTDMIADKINFVIPKRNKIHIPTFKDNDKILDEKIQQGIKKKFPEGFSEEYSNRLNFELEIIREAKLVDYFLIVEDYHSYAKNDLDSFCAIGRGSGGGSLLLYILDVTALDPIKEGLLFERFLTRERLKKDFPDIDSDFPLDVKEKIQLYLKNKYGEKKVFHVGTYTSIGPKGAVKDLCRIYKIDYMKTNELTKEINNELSWEQNLEVFKNNNSLWTFYKENQKVLDLVPRFEGLIKNGGMHASGLVILDDTINNVIPVDRVGGEIVTAFQESGSCTELDSVGVIKFDILGLKTLGIIKETYKNIVKYNQDNTLSEQEWKTFLYHLPKEDQGIYDELKADNKYSLFQMSGNSYSNLVDLIKPCNFDEINAINAMARPGTINFADQYKDGKLNQVYKYHPEINKYLKSTYGTIMFQEQVMEIFHRIGGFTLEEADGVRSIMKKLSKADKKQTDLDKWKITCDKFAQGALSFGIPKDQIEALQNDILGFSAYSFNNSHAMAYTYIGAITAYLSNHYKREFYCAALNAEDNQDGMLDGINACLSHRISVIQPDINKSMFNFSISKDKEIVFGLNGIKFVGENAIATIVEHRPYKSFFEFISNSSMTGKVMNKRVVESLIYSGCFDSLDNNRKKLAAVYTAFRDGTKKEIDLEVFNSIETTDDELEQYEKEYLGMNIFNTKFKPEVFNKLARTKLQFSKDFSDVGYNSKYYLCLIESIRLHVDKKNNEMAFIELKDMHNKIIKTLIFASQWKFLKQKAVLNNLYMVMLRKEKKDNKESVMIGMSGFVTEESSILNYLVNITEKLKK